MNRSGRARNSRARRRTLRSTENPEGQGGRMRRRRTVWLGLLVLGAMAVGGSWNAGDLWTGRGLRVATAQTGIASTHSSPIAITSDGAEVWSVNPDNNSVSVFNVASDANVKVAEVAVGIE